MVKCILCGKNIKVDKHRIIPGGFGGKYTNGNVIYLCKLHHYRIHSIIHQKLKELKRKQIELESKMYEQFFNETLVELIGQFVRAKFPQLKLNRRKKHGS